MRVMLILAALAAGCWTPPTPAPYETSNERWERRKAEQEAWEIERAEQRQAAREAYVAEHPDLDAEIADALTRGTFALGMTREEIELAFGSPPRDVRTTVTPEIVVEELIYPAGLSCRLENGLLVAWTTGPR